MGYGIAGSKKWCNHSKVDAAVEKGDVTMIRRKKSPKVFIRLFRFIVATIGNGVRILHSSAPVREVESQRNSLESS